MLAKVINSLPLPTFAINKRHQVIVWNVAIEVLTGIPKEKMLGTNCQWQAFYTQERPTLADLVVDAASNDEIETYYQDKCIKSPLIDGGYEALDFCPVLGNDGVWLRFSASPITNDKGEITGAIETLEDITERVHAEESLLESEQRFRDLTETTPDMIWEVDADGIITYVSPRIRDLLGYEQEKITGSKATIHMSDEASCEALTSAIRSRNPFAGLILSRKHIDGHDVTFESNGVPFFDSDGSFHGYRGVDRDITRRKKAERAIQESERSYRELFEIALDAIWVHDLEGHILKANEAMEKLTGFSADELANGNVGLFMTEEGLHLARDLRTQLSKDEAISRPYEQRLVRKDGTEVDVMFSTSSIFRNGQLVAFQHIARDISEQKRMQRNLHYYLQQITRAQEEERKRISRDLHDDTSQSLLLVIHRLDALVSSANGRTSQSVRQELAELYTLMVDIHSRLRRYARDLRPAILDDLGLIAALEWIADDMTFDDEVKVITKLDTQVQKLPRESELVLFRIAKEALNNARRHSRASEVIIQLEAKTGKVKLSISDNGCGFELPPSLTEFGGAGKLGLMGMEERAQLVGGTLSIQSQPDQGTTVIVEIPQ